MKTDDEILKEINKPFKQDKQGRIIDGPDFVKLFKLGLSRKQVDAIANRAKTIYER